MNNIFYTYELIDLASNLPFYIGKGKNNRMYFHYRSAFLNNKMKNKHLYNKMRQLIDNNFEPVYKKIFESESEQECFNKEIERIEEIGISNLCNISLGGSGGDNISQNPNREKIINNIRLSMARLEIKQKMIENHADVHGIKNPMYDKKHSFESIQKMKNRALERKHTDETRNKQSKSQKNRFAKLKEKIVHIGIENPRFCGITNKQLEKIIVKNTTIYNRKLKQVELNKITGIKCFSSKYRKRYFGKMTNYLNEVASNLLENKYEF